MLFKKLTFKTKNSMKKLTVGVDIGGTNTVSGLVDNEGKCYGTLSFKTRDFVVFDDYIDRLCQDINNLKKVAKIEYELAGIGIGAPNANYFTGNIENPANLHWKDKAGNDLAIIPFVEMVKRHFPSTPVAMTNDANAAALGEMYYGGAKGMQDFLVITLGTGLGSGFVSKGDVIYGHDSFAGELGHICVEKGGRRCGCGNRGCLEAYVSAPGIKRTVFEVLAETNSTSELSNFTIENLESKDIYEAATRGDAVALEAFERTGEVLGMGIAAAVAVTSPEAVFLFGGLAKSGKYILEPTKKYMEQYMLKNFRNKIKLLPSGIDSANAAILGASALAWQKYNQLHTDEK